MSENTESRVDTSKVTPTGKQPGSPVPTSRGLSSGAIVALVVVVLLIFGLGLFAAWQIGRSTATGTGSTTQSGGSSIASLNGLPEAVAAKFRQSVVQINIVTLQGGGGVGSGTIIDNRGYIVTNEHVIEGAKQILVTLYDGLQLPA